MLLYREDFQAKQCISNSGKLVHIVSHNMDNCTMLYPTTCILLYVMFHNSKNLQCCIPHMKGIVSQDFRWLLPYIIRKLSTRRGDATYKILLLLKDQFTIYKKQSSMSTAGTFNISQLILK
jgi:hypothetical protein